MGLRSAVTWLRMSPRRTGLALGLIALLIWFVAGLFLAPGAGRPEWGGPVLVALLIGLGLLAGLAVPGRRGWSGYVIGGATASIVIGCVAAFLPYDPANSKGDLPITGLARVILVAFAGALYTVVSSAGYPLAMVVRGLARPPSPSSPIDAPSGDIDAH